MTCTIRAHDKEYNAFLLYHRVNDIHHVHASVFSLMRMNHIIHTLPALMPGESRVIHATSFIHSHYLKGPKEIARRARL
jgi:hypothetical protein